jgi:predicted nucleic acid-binding protein
VSFCFDTSAILDAWVRHYPPDVFPTIWDRMDQAATQGQICVIEEVVIELKRKDDDIYKWIESRESMIVAIDEDIQRNLAAIMKNYPRLVDTKKNRSGCDPWVIAHAQSRGHAVVTAEKATGSLTKPKIPDVCGALAVPCIGVVEFFRRQGWRV